MALRMRLHRLLYLQIIFLLFGCATNKAVDSIATERFESAVKEWTASGKIYRGLKLLLSVSATCMTSEFRNIYLEKYAQDHFLSATEKEKMVEEERKKAEKGLEFIVYMFSDQELWNNLEEDDSMWTVVLTDEAGHTVKPIEIYQIDPVPVYIADLFPKMTHWKKVYSVVFPRKVADTGDSVVISDARNFTLGFRSAIGHLSLAF